MNVHNLTIIASMCIAGVAISCGGWWAVAGISWNLFVMMANITAPDKKSGAATGSVDSPRNQFNIFIIAQLRDRCLQKEAENAES